MKICGIIAAGGTSQRFGANKLELELSGKSVLAWSQTLLLTHPQVSYVVTVSSEIELAQKIGIKSEFMGYAKAGATRQESVRNALMKLPESDIVLIHDGARPFATARMIDELIKCSTEAACVIPVIPCTSAIKISEMNVVTGHVKGKYMLAQTPQLVWTDPLRLAFDRFGDRLDEFPDESSMMSELGVHVKTIPGASANIKITTPDDEVVAKAIAGSLFRQAQRE
jgi:2-C-methyl-D-erythritol 4-phosphate cytidylyltransferase